MQVQLCAYENHTEANLQDLERFLDDPRFRGAHLINLPWSSLTVPLTKQTLEQAFLTEGNLHKPAIQQTEFQES